MSKLDNKLAFPVCGHQVDASGAYCGTFISSPGLTKREWFAGMALQGLLILSPEICKNNGWKKISKEDMAQNAFIYADAMLAESNKDIK